MYNKEVAFWDWFSKHNGAYLLIEDVDDEVRERLLNDLLIELHKYNDGLYFELGGSPGQAQELIVTAEGNIEQFESVENLINKAPILDSWVFIAFLQPTDDDNTIDYEDVQIKRSELWFMPLDSASNPSSIGIQVCVPDFGTLKKSKWLDNAVYKMLDTVLGEKAFAEDIDHLTIGELPAKPEEKGMIELMELAAFIKWKKRKLNR